MEFHWNDLCIGAAFKESVGGGLPHLERMLAQGAQGRDHKGGEGLVGSSNKAEFLRNPDSLLPQGVNGAKGGICTCAVKGVTTGLNCL